MEGSTRNSLWRAPTNPVLFSLLSTAFLLGCCDAGSTSSARSVEVVSEPHRSPTDFALPDFDGPTSRLPRLIDSLADAGDIKGALLKGKAAIDSILVATSPDTDLIVSLNHKLIHLEPDSAEMHRGRSGALINAVRDPKIRARFFDERAHSYEVGGKKGKAEVDYLRALAALESTGKPDDVVAEQLARVCHNYGFTLYHMGRSADAEAMFLRSAGIRTRLAASPDQQLAKRAQVDYAGDLDFLPGWHRKLECLRIRQELIPTDVLRMGWALHNACGHIFNTGESIDSMPSLARRMMRHYEPHFRSNGRFKQDYSRSFLYMAYYHAAKGHTDSTDHFVRKGLGVWTKDGRFDLRDPHKVEFNDRYGGVYHTSVAAETYYRLYTSTHDPVHAEQALRLWQLQDDYIDAVVLRSASNSETHIAWKLELNASIVRQLCALEALSPDKGRAQMIAARINDQRKIWTRRMQVLHNAGVLGTLAEDLGRLEAQLNSRNARSSGASDHDEHHLSLMEDVDSIRTAIARLGELVPPDLRTSVLDLTALQDSIPQGTAVIEYLKFDAFIARAVITREKLDVRALDTLSGGEARTRALLGSLQTALGAPSIRDSLCTLLLPERSLLTELDQLVIIPDQQLARVPFECLLASALENAGRSTERPSTPTVRYATDLAAAVRSCYKPAVRAELTILACAPEYPSTDRNEDESEVVAALSRSQGDFDRDCGPLEFNGAEVRSISTLVAAEVLDPTTDLKREFTTRAAKAGVIHLAMHGFSSDQDPALSGLVFDARRDHSPPSDVSDSAEIRDGTLRSYEIKGLELDAELVVLSACQTAAGTYMNGEGTMSLTTSFMEAGARNVISSLWKVDDRATKEIMVKFYEKLAEGLGKADALAEAKRWYRKENPNAPPSHWAAFILIGDNEPVRLKKRSPVRPGMIVGGAVVAIAATLAARRRRRRTQVA